MTLSWTARFWTKVEKTSTCWNWLGAVSKRRHDQYGKFNIGGKIYRAHRVSFCLEKGLPLEARINVLHSCDNPRCVRPAHLRSGTHINNMADMIARKRHHTGPQNSPGETNGNASLTAQIVLAIRRLIAEGQTNTSIAKEYGVHHSTISLIRRGKSWNNAGSLRGHVGS
mgnify:CR=1